MMPVSSTLADDDDEKEEEEEMEDCLAATGYRRSWVMCD
jgi:hypothetical protein